MADPSIIDQLPAVQPGSIVSKKILSDDARRVIAFSFAAGQELTEHSTPLEARMEVHTGRMIVTVAGVATEAGPGQSVALPAGIPHAVRALDDCQAVLTMQR